MKMVVLMGAVIVEIGGGGSSLNGDGGNCCDGDS